MDGEEGEELVGGKNDWSLTSASSSASNQVKPQPYCQSPLLGFVLFFALCKRVRGSDTLKEYKTVPFVDPALDLDSSIWLYFNA